MEILSVRKASRIRRSLRHSNPPPKKRARSLRRLIRTPRRSKISSSSGQENPASSGACIDDLTELSLLELMSVRVSAEPTPVLPQLQPVDLDTLFDRSDETENNNRENLNEDSSEDTFFPLVADPVQTLPPFNVSPIAGNDKFAIAEDGTLTVTGSGVLKNDTDGNGDSAFCISVQRSKQRHIDAPCQWPLHLYAQRELQRN